MANILERDGLSIELLKCLSYESKLGINLKKNLHYFNEGELFAAISELLPLISERKMNSDVR